MGITFMVMFLMAMVVIVVVPMVFFGAQQFDTGGGIDGPPVMEKILHEFFQTGTGDDNGLCRLGCFYLAYVERIVVEAGNLFRYQPGYGDAGAFADPGGEFIDGEGGGGNFCRFRVFGYQPMGGSWKIKMRCLGSFPGKRSWQGISS